jgi:hypothetical protein
MMSKTKNKFSPEVRERAVRMVQDHHVDYPSRWGGRFDRGEDRLRAADAA